MTTEKTTNLKGIVMNRLIVLRDALIQNSSEKSLAMYVQHLNDTITFVHEKL